MERAGGKITDRTPIDFQYYSVALKYTTFRREQEFLSTKDGRKFHKGGKKKKGKDTVKVHSVRVFVSFIS